MLVADDDPVHRGLMEDLMSPLGFVLFSAATGNECLEVAAQCRPDLLLLDISMPGLNGWAVAERLRQMGFDRLKIVVISANAAQLRRPPGSVSYHDDFMVKPISISDLLARIGDAMRIEWDTQAPEGADAAAGPAATPEDGLDERQKAELRQLALDRVCAGHPHAADFDRGAGTPERRPVSRGCGSFSRTFNLNSFVTRLVP